MNGYVQGDDPAGKSAAPDVRPFERLVAPGEHGPQRDRAPHFIILAQLSQHFLNHLSAYFSEDVGEINHRRFVVEGFDNLDPWCVDAILMCIFQWRWPGQLLPAQLP